MKTHPYKCPILATPASLTGMRLFSVAPLCQEWLSKRGLWKQLLKGAIKRKRETSLIATSLFTLRSNFQIHKGCFLNGLRSKRKHKADPILHGVIMCLYILVFYSHLWQHIPKHLSSVILFNSTQSPLSHTSS